MNATRAHQKQSRRYRTHALSEAGRPLCGGGHNARQENTWQTDLADPDCHRCLTILARRVAQAAQPAPISFGGGVNRITILIS